MEIAAPIEVVWDVLTDVDDWPRWFTEGTAAAISGPVAPGTTLRMKGRDPGTVRARIERVEQPHLLAWTGRTLGISAIHVWLLDRKATRRFLAFAYRIRGATWGAIFRAPTLTILAGIHDDRLACAE